MNLFRRALICTSAAAVSAATLVVGAAPASAAHVACGQTITLTTTFDGSVGPCASGLVVGADNITIDLAGYTLSGTPEAGEGPGIDIGDHTGVTVRNGTVTRFDTGVAVQGGSGNTVTGMTLMANRGGGDFGEGVLIFAGTANTVSANRVQDNGPYGGVSLLVASHNVVTGNQISGNAMSTTNTSGIRLENIGHSASNDNTISDNLVQGSGLDGIELFAGASTNRIQRNTVVQNNRDGITAFAGSSGNLVEDNQIRSNGFGPIAGDGIYLRAAQGTFGAPSGNVVRRNVSTGNKVYDLRDGTPDCGTNLWSANTAVTGTPPCVFTP